MDLRSECEVRVMACKIVRSVLTDVVYEMLNGMVRYALNYQVMIYGIIIYSLCG